MNNLIDPTNTELYTLALADAPYVIAAYAILWLALCIYVTMILRRMMRIEKQIDVLSETIGTKRD